MPWTVNSEIYPLWARSTGNACSSGINWIFNVLVSLTFLHTAEYLTYYGKRIQFHFYFILLFLDLLSFVIEKLNGYIFAITNLSVRLSYSPEPWKCFWEKIRGTVLSFHPPTYTSNPNISQLSLSWKSSQQALQFNGKKKHKQQRIIERSWSLGVMLENVSTQMDCIQEQNQSRVKVAPPNVVCYAFHSIISAIQTKVCQDPLRPAVTTAETINVAEVFM